uniref:Uncharacterized protein n=1 Tax=Ditylum brightwellii TaxID=49249 RepID=A0A6U3RTQ8_9STRA|mmetsp:Transcript_27742/g.41276  ORF Transcript_27742/g.41276 Transcript_27742/m.41276 type:complete len:299 (+) Transcript_27742:241-1137(+)
MAGRGRGRGRGRPLTMGQELLRSSAEECGLDARNLRSLQDVTRPQFFPEISLHSSGNQAQLMVEQLKLQKQQQQQNQQGARIKPDPDGNGGGTPGGGGEEDTKKAIVGVKRTAQTVFLISKTWELHHRMRNSAHYVRPTKDVPDIIRYSDLIRPSNINKKRTKKEEEEENLKNDKRNKQQHDASTVLTHCLGGRTYTQSGRFVPEELISGQKRRIRIVDGMEWYDGELDGKTDLDALAKQERIDRIRERLMKGKDGSDEGSEVDPLVDSGEESEPDDYGKDHYESSGDSDGGDDEPLM